MKYSSTLIALAILALSESVCARPAARPGMTRWSKRDVTTLLTGGPTANGSTVHIRKLPGGTGTASDRVPLRNEFGQFLKNPKNINLYVLALEAMQKMSEDVSNPLSFFQIAKIHGSPFEMSWDSVGPVPGNENMGYCVHGDVMFPTWHRPYVALYEQALYDQIQTIAGQFTTSDAQEWKDVAAEWRLPYWDWAANSAIPDALMQPKWDVTRPDGKTENIANPLYSYVFHPAEGRTLEQDIGKPYSDMKQTLRHPKQAEDGTWAMDNEEANAVMVKSQKDIRTETYNLLTAFDDYTKFSNHAADKRGMFISIEGIHDGIHDKLGGDNGFMGDISVAAFDPVFWMHHANVDRVFALWQAIHPDSYLVPTTNKMGTYSQAPNTVEDVNTALTPFHGAGDVWWTAASSRDTANFGYGYPDIPQGSPSEVRDAVLKTVNDLYFYSDDVAKKLKSIDHTDDSSNGRLGAAPNDPNTYREYVVNVQAPQDALDGSYSITVFLGEVTVNDASKFYQDPNYIGSVGVFSREGNAMAAGKLVGGTVSLTEALLDRQQKGELKNFRTSVVNAFCKENLKFRVKKSDGTLVEAVKGLNLEVVSSEVKAPGTENTTWGPLKGSQPVPPSAGNPNAANEIPQ